LKLARCCLEALPSMSLRESPIPVPEPPSAFHPHARFCLASQD